MQPTQSDWFLFKDLRRTSLQRAAWIPLRSIEYFRKEKVYGDVGYLRDTFACGSLAVPLVHRELGEALTWSDIGIGHDTRSYSDENGYKPVDVYWLDWANRSANATELVICHYGGNDHTVWQLNQDLVCAFNLLQEGDSWVYPDEGYVEVARIKRSLEGRPVRIEIKTEYLRDYLAARQMALRIAWYRDRDAVVEDVSGIPWSDAPPTVSEPHYRFEARCHDLHEGSGMPFGGQSAIFTSRRTDVHPDEDVPEFGAESDNNTESESRQFGQQGRRVFRVEGEIWCEEWIEPSQNSTRIRGDKAPSSTSFIVDASGVTMNSDELNNEDIGRYLWFRPEVIPDIIKRRGASLKWHTRDTASVELVHGYYVHFGMNKSLLVNCYAYDVAKLPEWQRRIWQGFNISPDGGVCEELLNSQMRVRPSRTLAPEAHFIEAISELNAVFYKKFGFYLFSKYESTGDIAASIHRFRAIDESGFFSLCKDIARLIIEPINTNEIQKIAPPTKSDPGKGSLKTLERLLSTWISKDEARSVLTRLVGIYELRGADAHIPSSQLDQAFRLAGVNRLAKPLQNGLHILMLMMNSLVTLIKLIEAAPNIGQSTEI